MKQRTLEIQLPEWANWLAQDKDGSVWAYNTAPIRLEFRYELGTNKSQRAKKLTGLYVAAPDWQNSRTNLNKESCYIDQDGILRREPKQGAMLEEQA